MFDDIYKRVVLEPEEQYVTTNEILYADDTLLLSSKSSNLQTLLNTVVEEGAKYGLEINWKKTNQMGISAPAVITRPTGEVIEGKRNVVYLGGLVTCDGKATIEVNRRIGESRAVFKQLNKIWAHANVTVKRKLAIYRACVITKLLHSLESLWLLKKRLRTNRRISLCMSPKNPKDSPPIYFEDFEQYCHGASK